jgi:hypothetical protein
MSRCLAADSGCVYNPLTITYDADNGISAGWERSAARSYTSSSEIAAPGSWAAAQLFDGATVMGVEYPAGAFTRCNEFEGCKMVQCKDKNGQDKFACTFHGDIENGGTYGVAAGADDSNWSAIGAAGSADITTWQRYPESFFQIYDNDLGVCRHTKAGTETKATSDKCYAKRKAGQNGQHSTSTFAAMVSSCTNDADCEWVAPWTYNPYETYQVADAATFTVRRHRSLGAGSRVAKAGADTPQKCAKACLTQLAGCGAFEFDTVATTCHTTGLNVQETPSAALTNTHNVDYYELLIYKQPVRGDRRFCTHNGANGNEWDTQIVATCRSYTTEDADRVTTTDMDDCVSGNGCQFNDELT